jgi:hypothetical protein
LSLSPLVRDAVLARRLTVRTLVRAHGAVNAMLCHPPSGDALVCVCVDVPDGADVDLAGLQEVLSHLLGVSVQVEPSDVFTFCTPPDAIAL